MKYDELQQLYAQDEYYWGTEPNELVKRAVEHAPDQNTLTAVDVGAGEGRDSVYLAEQGITVTAIDIAPNGLEKAEQLAEEKAVSIEVAQGDINTLTLTTPIDIFYSIGTIQYLRPDERHDQFSHFKSQTRPGGIHALFAFVDKDEIPPAPDWGDNEYFYDEGELSTYYEDWDCLYADDVVFDDDSGGEPHQHAGTEALYQKPSSG
ncbi:methyltransferase domain-containing protein [Halocatena halophila]|uniref:methyltransferase domain-containing protein n=1 Tax=Halocatena halophila TaxID=2814576 RepID=UPI002ED267B1